MLAHEAEDLGVEGEMVGMEGEADVAAADAIDAASGLADHLHVEAEDFNLSLPLLVSCLGEWDEHSNAYHLDRVCMMIVVILRRGSIVGKILSGSLLFVGRQLLWKESSKQILEWVLRVTMASTAEKVSEPTTYIV